MIIHVLCMYDTEFLDSFEGNKRADQVRNAKLLQYLLF